MVNRLLSRPGLLTSTLSGLRQGPRRLGKPPSPARCPAKSLVFDLYSEYGSAMATRHSAFFRGGDRENPCIRF